MFNEHFLLTIGEPGWCDVLLLCTDWDAGNVRNGNGEK